jgi:hypothetical protein
LVSKQHLLVSGVGVIVDFDDFCEDDHRLSLLQTLRDVNPLFRCTLFAIPALGSADFWNSVPDWCELAVHGWEHPNPHEAAEWTQEQALDVLLSVPDRFVAGFKAPGWQISDGTYAALQDLGWWVADHWENDDRRPDGILAHVITPAAGAGMDPDHWHGHIGNVCGNGIQETFPELLRRVREATSFELVGESVSEWRAKVRA